MRFYPSWMAQTERGWKVMTITTRTSALRAVSVTSVADRMALAGATSGFDYMRLVLATAVLFWHSFGAMYGHDAGSAFQAGVFGAVLRIILPMFFALSGFLVASSMERTRSLLVFLAFRALRIGPALAVEVILSALIVGPLATTASLHDYFASPLFGSYFLNVVGNIHYILPGVFTANPWPDIVNASLWTVPYELECYVALALAYVVTLMRRPALLGLLVVGLSLAFVLAFGKTTAAELAIDPVPGRMLVLSFLAGVAVNVGRMYIPYSKGLCACCVALALLLLSRPGLQFLAVLPVAYLTVWLGLLNPLRLPLLLSGDYSYGIYLYGFVVQQSLMQVFHNQITSMGVLFVGALLGAFAFAFVSWHLVEKPALHVKRRVMALAGRGPRA